MNTLKKVILVLVSVLINGIQSQAQWSTNPAENNAICTAQSDQTAPASVSDGSGGAIIVWYDLRIGGYNDIYAQRISATGEIQWNADGVAICTASNDQIYPTIVSDGSGGAIIAWYDLRNGTGYDVYAQRISATGELQWTSDGVAICTAIGDQIVSVIVSDGSGGAIITWEDNRNVYSDIFAQRINAYGQAQWNSNGVAICTMSDDQFRPNIVSDGSGGAIITWEDLRNGNNYNIYTQRISAGGEVLWNTNGVAICTAIGDQRVPVIVSDGSGGAIITWLDKRNGGYSDIYAQRISATGEVQWTSDGVAICTATNDQRNPVIASDESGGAIIVWSDLRSGSYYDIYAQRISATGEVLWNADGVAICTTVYDQGNQAIVSDGSGGAIITWEDRRNGTYDDIYAQRISATGEIQWNTDGVAVCAAENFQADLAIVNDGSGGAIIGWYDFRNGNWNIYAQRIYAYGTLSPAPHIAISPTSWIYGVVDVGSYEHTDFLISNQGTADLNVTTTIVLGVDASEFSVQGGGAFTLSPGNSRQITVRFRPTSAGAKSAQLNIISDDPDESPIIISLNGTGALIVVDGIKDNFYLALTGPGDGHIQLRSYACNDNGAPTNDADLSAKIWASWDEERLYIYEEVRDDAVSGNSSTVWENDCVELIIDPQPGDSVTNSNWCTRLTALGMETVGVDTADNLDNVSNDKKQWVRRTETGGYVLEFAVKWSAIQSGGEALVPMTGNIFGMAINQHDNDGNGSRSATVQWAAVLSDAAWCTPKYCGTVKFLENHKLEFTARNNMTGMTNPVFYDGSDYGSTEAASASMEKPGTFDLRQNYPNPFNPTTTIGFQIPQSGQVKLTVYDLFGREVKTLINKEMKSGSHQCVFDGSGLASGVYMYRLQANGFVQSKKFVLLK